MVSSTRLTKLFLEFARRISRLENLYEESTKTDTLSKETSTSGNLDSLEAGDFLDVIYLPNRRRSKSN